MLLCPSGFRATTSREIFVSKNFSTYRLSLGTVCQRESNVNHLDIQGVLKIWFSTQNHTGDGSSLLRCQPTLFLIHIFELLLFYENLVRCKKVLRPCIGTDHTEDTFLSRLKRHQVLLPYSCTRPFCIYVIVIIQIALAAAVYGCTATEPPHSQKSRSDQSKMKLKPQIFHLYPLALPSFVSDLLQAQDQDSLFWLYVLVFDDF